MALGLNPGHCNEKPATNNLSYDMTLVLFAAAVVSIQILQTISRRKENFFFFLFFIFLVSGFLLSLCAQQK
jgi:hypothetical protein